MSKPLITQEDDRRDSPRIPMSFLVRDVGQEDGVWEEREGDLGLGGISWTGKTPALGTEVDCRFRLPGVSQELRARGEILRVRNDAQGPHFQLRFTDLDLDTERAIARFLDELAKS